MDAFEKEHKKKMKEVTKAEELLDAAQQQFKVFEREDTKLRTEEAPEGQPRRAPPSSRSSR